jgi:hypothetical protein
MHLIRLRDKEQLLEENADYIVDETQMQLTGTAADSTN